MTQILTISKTTQRRFILHKQGLYPAQSWQGKNGVIEAVRSGAVVQVCLFQREFWIRWDSFTRSAKLQGH